MTTPWEEGNPDSKICILGEAPARQEMIQRRPLVGPSGHLLEQCMHAAGMVRKECYIINLFPFEVIRVQEVGKDMDGNILWNKNGLTEHGKECAKPSLGRLLKCSANVVVPLGNVPLEFCVGHQSITKWRGSILDARFNRKTIPTIHPAASLRGQYMWRYLIISDLKRAKEESNSPLISLPKRELLIDPTYSESIEFLQSLQGSKRFATDIECLNHQVSCMSFSPSWDMSMSIPLLSRHGGPRWTVEEEMEIWRHIAFLMGDEKIQKINQNIIFDIGFIFRQNNIITRGKLGDPGIAITSSFLTFVGVLIFYVVYGLVNPTTKTMVRFGKSLG